MTLRFRHLDVDPSEPVSGWPMEGVLTAVERGSLRDWRRMVQAVRADPWGPLARRLEDALSIAQPYGTAVLLRRALERARTDAEAAERAEVARRVRAVWRASGMTQAAFAQAIGTSPSRLSTYLHGRVAPSSPLMVRMERVAGSGAHTADSRR